MLSVRLNLAVERRINPHPHPAFHLGYIEWVAGWGCGLAPRFPAKEMLTINSLNST